MIDLLLKQTHPHSTLIVEEDAFELLFHFIGLGIKFHLKPYFLTINFLMA